MHSQYLPYTPRGYIILTMHTTDTKKLVTRLKKIEGQVRGLQKMVFDDAYCIDVITQSSAIRHALSSFEDKLLEQHLSSCVVNQIKEGKEEQAIGEVLAVLRQAKKG